VKDDIAKETIGEGYEKFTTFLLTVFFFILYCNLLGLVPYGASATGNLGVTATLAGMSFFIIQGAGIYKNGFIGYFKGLMPHGIPLWVAPVMFIVEFLGLFTKAFALAIRLFANMTAGHVIIFSIIGLIFMFNSYLIAPVSVGFTLFLYFLKILVALIQAYIFTILSALFIGMAVHQEH
jgi:F-type H+-transporting ATPase subunit a